MMNLSKLSEPFQADEVEFRIGQTGEYDGKPWAMCLAYISARAIQDRLDFVCGPENWKVAYEFISTTGVICKLSIKCGDEWVTKQDGAEMTDIEAFKGGISSALKRAGSAWGMGRYLYSLEADYAQIVDKKTKGAHYAKSKNGNPFYWLPPALPAWALPKKEASAAPNIGSGTPNIAPNTGPVIAPKGIVTPPAAAVGPTNAGGLTQEEYIKSLKGLFASAKSAGWSEDELKVMIKAEYGFDSTKQLNASQFRELVSYINTRPNPASGAKVSGAQN